MKTINITIVFIENEFFFVLFKIIIENIEKINAIIKLEKNDRFLISNKFFSRKKNIIFLNINLKIVKNIVTVIVSKMNFFILFFICY
jgi:hypothetical protein